MHGVVGALGAPVEMQKGDMNYSILPLLHPRTGRFYADGLFHSFALDKWEAFIEEWLSVSSDQKVVRVLLSHAGFETDKKIAEKIGDLDLIIGGH